MAKDGRDVCDLRWIFRSHSFFDDWMQLLVGITMRRLACGVRRLSFEGWGSGVASNVF